MMKKVVSMAVVLAFCVMPIAQTAHADQMDILVNKLVEKGVLTPYEAQILIADAKEDAAKELAAGKAVTAPTWTQKIKIKGDVRFRTQTDWGKGLGPAHERLRQRVRARIGLEGKVNDQVSAGILAVSGGNDPRSTNQTLDDNWETQDFRLDAYYIKWTPEIPEKMGDATVWLGKFKNPLNKTELLWDSDICPGGSAIQYQTIPFDLGFGSSQAYANFGAFWVDELSRSERDPFLWVFQGGYKWDITTDWNDGRLNMALAYYDFANVKNNPGFLQGATIGGSTTNNITPYGEYGVDFNLVDLILKYDGKSLFGWDIGHGVFTDLIYNASAASGRFGYIIGGYIGTKKPKKPGQWKLWANWRAIGRNAVPDFMPDSDFYGFRYLRRGGTPAGAPMGGGTNGQGINFGVDYAAFKNTVLSAEYYYCSPIQVDASNSYYREPYQLLQLDVKVKF